MTPECYGCLSIAYSHLKRVGVRRHRSGRRIAKQNNAKHIHKAQKMLSKAKRLGAQVEFPKIFDQWGDVDLTGFELSLKEQIGNF